MPDPNHDEAMQEDIDKNADWEDNATDRSEYWFMALPTEQEEEEDEDQ